LLDVLNLGRNSNGDTNALAAQDYRPTGTPVSSSMLVVGAIVVMSGSAHRRCLPIDPSRAALILRIESDGRVANDDMGRLVCGPIESDLLDNGGAQRWRRAGGEDLSRDFG
jgi:hypothetical protein